MYERDLMQRADGSEDSGGNNSKESKSDYDNEIDIVEIREEEEKKEEDREG